MARVDDNGAQCVITPYVEECAFRYLLFARLVPVVGLTVAVLLSRCYRPQCDRTHSHSVASSHRAVAARPLVPPMAPSTRPKRRKRFSLPALSQSHSHSPTRRRVQSSYP